MRETYISITSEEQASTKKVFSAIKCANVRSPKEFCSIALKYPIILAKLKEGSRKKENVIGIDWIQYDFDENVTCAEIQEKLQNFFYIMLGSKNHQKEKTDKEGNIIPACDRFHVFILLDKPIEDPEYYRFYIDMFGKDNNFAFKMDKQARDITRYFDKHSCVIKINEGGTIDNEKYKIRFEIFNLIEEDNVFQNTKKLLENNEIITEERKKQAVINYLKNSKESISGEQGHDTTFAAACQLISIGGKFEDFEKYNIEKCKPQWMLKDLKHKWKDALKKSNGIELKNLLYWSKK